MAANVVAFVVFAISILVPSQSFAGCTVSEIVRMAKGGAGKSVLESKCDYRVDDAPRCSFSRVAQLALAKKYESDISDECGACDRPRCEVGRRSCSLGSRAPRGIKEGDDCYCNTPMGPVQGEVSCNN
jgi:hypothetical protein